MPNRVRTLPAARPSASPFVLSALLVTLVACPAPSPGSPDAGDSIPDAGGSPSDAGHVAIARIEVRPDPELVCLPGCFFMRARDTRRFVAEAFDAAEQPIADVAFTWSTGDASIATVDAAGLVTTHAPGEVELSASAHGTTGRAFVFVDPATITRIVVSPPTLVLAPGATAVVTATAYDERDVEVPDVLFDWTVAAPRVVSLATDTGTVTALQPGHAVLVATSPTGGQGFAEVVVEGEPDAPAFQVRSLVPGIAHTCALAGSDDDATQGTLAASCWGWNFWGQLGDGLRGEQGEMFPSPRAVASTLRFRSLTASYGHTCALEGDGTAWCWGVNSRGKLGVDPDGLVTGGSPLPLAVAGGHRFTTIAAGYDHTCAVDDLGNTWCWGANFSGQLGDRSRTDASAPVVVDSLETFVQLAAGLGATCGRTADGRVLCWGSDDAGQLGDGEPWGDTTIVDVPRAVSGETRFTSIAMVGSHACGLDTDGKALCWGRNGSGQLGDGTTDTRPAPAEVSTTLRFTQLAPGSHHTCGLADDGSAWCWGDNSYGSWATGRSRLRSRPSAWRATSTSRRSRRGRPARARSTSTGTRGAGDPRRSASWATASRVRCSRRSPCP